MGEPIHPSLKAYIQCFLSSPFPKQFPRGGGLWDQDPLLLRDFRIIQRFEREWKQNQEKISSASNEIGFNKSKSGSVESSGQKGGGLGLEDSLNEYLEELGEDGYF